MRREAVLRKCSIPSFRSGHQIRGFSENILERHFVNRPEGKRQPIFQGLKLDNSTISDLMNKIKSPEGFEKVFSVTRRSRSDSVSQSVSQLLTLRTKLTDVTLVSEDTY